MIVGGCVAAALLLFALPRPTQAAGYVPDPPTGWSVHALAGPASIEGFQFDDGVVVVSTGQAEAGSLESTYDVYRLGGGAVSTGVAADASTLSTTCGSAATGAVSSVTQSGDDGGVLYDYVRGVLFDMDGGLVAFGSERPGTDPNEWVLDLNVRDLGSGVGAQVPMPLFLKLTNGIPVVDDGRVVWSQFGFQYEPEVMLYDSATRLVRKLSPGREEACGYPDIDGDDVVWQSWNGLRHRMLHLDLSTGVTRELWAEPSGAINLTVSLEPQVDAGRAVWVTHGWPSVDEYRESLYLVDLVTGSVRLVASTSGHIQATLDGDLLVTQTSTDDGRQVLAVRDLSTDAVTTLAGSPTSSFGFSVDDGMVAWVSAAGLPGDQGYLGRIMVYDAAGGETIELAAGAGMAEPQVDRGRVVFVERLDAGGSKLWLAEPDDAEPYDYYLDVASNDPCRAAILDFTDRGFISGYLNGTFRTFHPGHPLLRAQAAKILINALGFPVDERFVVPSPFSDLGPDDPENLYPHEYVAAAALAGLMRGYSATTFGPWDRLTRAQMVTVAVRAIREVEPDVLEAPPAGYVGSVAGVPAVHVENVRVAEFNGLLDHLDGFGPGWDPNIFARRGEVVQILYEVVGPAD